MENAGVDLENVDFLNCNQIFAILKQICCSIAFAEKHLEFEHRDLYSHLFLDMKEISWLNRLTESIFFWIMERK